MTEPYKRKETIGDCTLYLGDAMQIMPTLPKSDLVISDVPYALTSGGIAKGEGTMSGIFAAENYSNNGQMVSATVPFPAMMQVIHDALVEHADCYVMANDKNVTPLDNAARAAGFSLHNLLVWDKVSPTANRWYMKNVEFSLYLWKGRARTINNPSSKQLIRGGIDKVTGHPTEKPVFVMAEYILNSSQPGDMVLDPFAGSGTTGVAAIQTGRRFTGIEIDEGYFEIACARLRQAITHPDMFAARQSEPSQEAFI